MAASGTTYGPQVLVELRPGSGPLRAQLEDRLRDAIRSGRLASGERLPSSRALARDLGVSRRLVVEGYAQLAAEGYLETRQGSGTVVAPGAAAPEPTPHAPARARLAYDFFPGVPDLSAFPRAAWARAMRDVLREAPDHALGYPDVRGAPELRGALAAHLRRARGLAADPERILVVSGSTQGLALLARVLHLRGVSHIAVERPGFPRHREILTANGLTAVRARVDRDGVDVGAIARSAAGAALVTPAHQWPLGVALSVPRRAALLDWARAGNLVIEDDYDAEFRYDRAPIGALQGLAPDHVAYLGTASKTLAPALRLAWLVLPASLVPAVAREKELADTGSPVLEQLVLARLLDSAEYDRHLRNARRRNRAKRDLLAATVERHLPDARVEGIAAGLHAIVRLAHPVEVAALDREARARDLAVYPLARPGQATDAIMLGYATLSEPAIAEGVRRLAAALGVLRP